jgi:CRP-like cAMP-binding protein
MMPQAGKRWSAMNALTQVNLKTILASATQEPLPDLELIAQEIQAKTYFAGETIFEQGRPHPYVYGISKGLIKLMYLDSDGNEWIKSFVPEGGFFASLSALQIQGNTSFKAVALERASLERLDYRTLLAVAKKSTAWAEVALNLTLAYAAKKEQRERELLTLNSEQRYLEFCQRSGHLLSRIPQKDLARHLGLTPVVLNRIVQRVKQPNS